MSYKILEVDGTAGIRCITCGFTSWNENDVRERYCGNCHAFHEKKIVIDAVQDRLILELYAWVCVDHRTGLEGICAISGGPSGQMQAVTSFRDTAIKLGEAFKDVTPPGKRIYLVRFAKAEVITTL